MRVRFLVPCSTVHLITVIAPIGGLFACAIPLTESSYRKTEIEIVAGNNEIGVYGKVLPEPIVVHVTIGGSRAQGLWVHWWAMMPNVGSHTWSDLCGYELNSHFGNTITNANGQTSNEWHETVVEQPVEPQEWKMRIIVRNTERDSVMAVDTVYATWQLGQD